MLPPRSSLPCWGVREKKGILPLQKERVKRAVWLEEKLPGATLLFLLFLVFFFLGGCLPPSLAWMGWLVEVRSRKVSNKQLLSGVEPSPPPLSRGAFVRYGGGGLLMGS